MAQTRRALDPDGTLISNGGGHADGKLGRTVRAMLASMVVRQQARPSVKTQNHDDLVALEGARRGRQGHRRSSTDLPAAPRPRRRSRTWPPATPAGPSSSRWRSRHWQPSPDRPRSDHRPDLRHRHRKGTLMSKATVTKLFIGGGHRDRRRRRPRRRGRLARDRQRCLRHERSRHRRAARERRSPGHLARARHPRRRRRRRPASIAGLVAWIGALLNTWQLESKAWFVAPAPAGGLQPRVLRDDRLPHRRAGRHRPTSAPASDRAGRPARGGGMTSLMGRSTTGDGRQDRPDHRRHRRHRPGHRDRARDAGCPGRHHRPGPRARRGRGGRDPSRHAATRTWTRSPPTCRRRPRCAASPQRCSTPTRASTCWSTTSAGSGPPATSPPTAWSTRSP